MDYAGFHTLETPLPEPIQEFSEPQSSFKTQIPTIRFYD
jgi:hypothetical protein